MRTQLTEQAAVLDAALAYIRAGLSVIPIRGDGSKRPDGDVLPKEYDVNAGKHRATWKPFQTRTPTEAEVGLWFDGHAERGTGILTGNGLWEACDRP